MPELSRSLVERSSRGGPSVRRAFRAIDTALMLGPSAAWRARRALRAAAPPRSARDALYTDIWSSAAAAVGARFTDLGGGFVELARDGRSVRARHQLTPVDDPVSLAVALDKPLGSRLLAGAGVPTPASAAFRLGADGPARRLLAQGGRVVVKPAVGTAGGEGVPAGITAEADLLRAALFASHWSPALLAEQHVPGHLHRVLLLDGELLDVIVDLPPSVTGDGRSTVEQLVAAENHRRRRGAGAPGTGLERLEPDLDLVLALRHSGLALSSVVPAGMRVAVKNVTNDRSPEDSTTYRGPVAPEVLAACRAAAAAVGLRLAGVDIVAERVDRPLSETGGVVIEVNGAPGVHRHYQVADPAAATRVAEPLLERLLSSG
jgi:D-alanine-D-alanine ligase-like ATP-grasp enzyme